MSKDRITALALFGFSIAYLVASWQLKVGTLRKPGPGFLPVIIAACLLVCAGIHLWRVMARPAAGGKAPEKACGTKEKLRLVGGLTACVLAYPFLLMMVDFVAATFAACLAMLTILRYKTMPARLLVSAAMAVICFVSFAMLLAVAVPSGPIETFFFRLRG